MMRKSLKALMLCLALSACQDDAAVGAADSESGTPKYASLVSVAPKDTGCSADVCLLPRETRQLDVRLLLTKGLPIADAPVDFALLDGAKGASLDAQSGQTDDAGEVSVELTAGPTAANFKVRVSHASADAMLINVAVREATDPTLRVAVTYDGKRPVVQRSVTVVPSMECAQVLSLNAIGDKTYSLAQDGDEASFNVGSGMRYAVAAWGRDSTGGRLSRGCVEVTTGVSARDVTLDVSVPLEDEPLTLAGEFPIVLEAPLAGFGVGLAPLFTDALGALTGARGVADEEALYVDALRTRFLALGGDAGVFDAARPRLATAFAAVGSESAFGAAYGSVLDARAAQFSLMGTLRVTDKTFALDVSSAQCADAGGTWSVALLGALAVPLDARFAPDEAAVQIATLALPITLANMVDALAQGPRNDMAPSLAGELAARVGCAGFADALRDDDAFLAVCDGPCVRAVCEAVVADLVVSSSAALAGHDDALLQISGPLAAHARDSGAIADLGPSELAGTFGDVASIAPILRSAVSRSTTL